MAHELAEPYPYVSTDDAATDAARLMAEHPGSQLVGRLVPEYALQDPPPAAGFDERDLKYRTGSPGAQNGRLATGSPTHTPLVTVVGATATRPGWSAR
ncbi:hypothetical protein OG604_36670 [Streptomyces sp. NBC_01231]|nr:hypothetical protein OG604_36670 [Streptomyces sp. NBC_01231]